MSCEKCGHEIKNYGVFLGGVRCRNYCNTHGREQERFSQKASRGKKPNSRNKVTRMSEQNEASVQCVVHTPGPWEVSKAGRSVLAGGVKINQSIGPCAASVGTQNRIDAELRANARLIAEAPEMLCCLRGLMDSIEAYVAFHKPQQEWDEYDHMMLPRWQAAKALLEKIM